MGDEGGRLHRCIRDLAALNALPSMCIGRSVAQAFGIILEALPTALGCDLVFVAAGSERRAVVRGRTLTDDETTALVAQLGEIADALRVVAVEGVGEVWCLDAAIPMGAEQGRLVAGRSTPLDLETDRVLIRSAANLVGTTLATANVLDAARRKDDFLAMLGHELRNPLAPIVTATELLAHHPDTKRECEIIDRHTRHLTRLVDDLLDISRAARGKIELRREVVTVDAILERAREIALPLVRRSDQSLEIATAPGVLVDGDPVRLAQVFGNLLTNASKFSPHGGRIRVTVDHEAPNVRVAVIDEGLGIAREDLGRIFEPFVQVGRADDRPRGGLGLGLAIVKSLIVQHEGTIAIASDGPGRGTTITIVVPTARRAEEPRPVAQPRPAAARRGVRVLVVDDNVDIADLLGDALDRAGFEAAVAYDGRSGVERSESFRPHAAVLDVGMPGLDGYGVARALRAAHPRALLIAATGYGQEDDRARAVEAGFDLHFVKPMSLHDLLAALDAHIASPVRLAAC